MIHDIKFHGDWKRPGNRYSELDLKILTNERSQHRLIDKYKNCGTDFKFHFYKGTKNRWGTSLEGFKNPEWVKTHFGLDIQPDDDKISVLVTNNIGSPKYPLTPWIIAHRMSHAIFRNVSFDIHRPSMIGMDNFFGWRVGYEKWLGCAIGTTRSCRKRTLSRTAELYHELFAQCLLTDCVRLNHVEDRVLKRMRGKNPEYIHLRDSKSERLNDLINMMENEVYHVRSKFDCGCGKILVV